MSSDDSAGADLNRRPWRAAAREAAVFSLFVGLSVLMTWPLTPNVGRAVSDTGDPLLNAWIMEWTWHALTHDASTFWHAPIFHPLRYTIAFSENLLGITLPLLPLYAAGVKPLVVYNVAMLLGFAFSGYGAYVLGRVVTGSTGAGVVAGIFYAFLPYRFDQIAHVQHIWSGWLPLAIAALILVVRRPDWARAVMLGVALLFNGLSNGHWLLFGGAAVALGCVTLAGLGGRWDRRYWLPLSIVIGLTYGGMYLFLQPYQKVGELYGMQRWAGEAAHYSAVPSDWLSSGRYNRLYGGTVDWERGERALFPGAIGLVLAALTVFLLRREDLEASGSIRHASGATDGDLPSWMQRLVRAFDILALLAFIAMSVGFADRGDHSSESWKRSAVPAVILLVTGLMRLWIAYPRAWGGPPRSLGERVRTGRYSPELWLAFMLVALGYLGSLGMNSFLHQFLYSNVEPFRSLRVPARWGMIAYVGLAMLVASGVLALLRRVRAKARPVVIVGVAMVLLLDLRAAPIRWSFFDASTPPVYEWLASAPDVGAILEIPVNKAWSEYRYLFGATVHHRPILNGVSGYPTKQHQAIRDALESDPVRVDLVDRLESVGCGLIVVHNEDYSTPDRVRAWLKGLEDSGRLTFVRRFDHGAGGDYVFAMTKVVPGAAALRDTETPDPAGRTPRENEEIFLDQNGKTYNASTFGWLDIPKFDYEVTGELDISGWAFSPWGVREVRLSFENGSVTMPAERYERAGLRAYYPWYPQTDLSGFRLTVPKRPDSVSLLTDLLVEIVDGRGEITQLDHLFLSWHPRKPIRVEGLDFVKLAAIGARAGANPEQAAAIRAGDLSPLVAILVEAGDGQSDDEFLETIFPILLDRAPDGEARHYYATRLGRGGKRRDVVEAILSSDELRPRLDRYDVNSP